MKIIIEKFICFDDVSGTLTNMDTQDSILLPITASLIFSYIISHQGEVLERAVIFENVWSKYGQTPSNNTLTQYISLIRKDLSNLGLPTEVIVTIPKVGFIVPLEVDINNSQTVHEEIDIHNPISSRVIILSLSSILIVMVSVLYYLAEYRLTEQVTYHLGYFHNCEIRGLSVMTSAQISSSLDRTNRFAELYLPCTDDAIYYIGLPHLATGKRSSRFILAQCNMSKKYDGKLTSCKSVLFYE